MGSCITCSKHQEEEMPNAANQDTIQIRKSVADLSYEGPRTLDPSTANRSRMEHDMSVEESKKEIKTS